jgi:Protein of unknown function (DUF3024)
METTNMATMEYKGYVARIDTDEENDGFHGRVIDISVDFRLGTHDVVLFESRPAFLAPHDWRDEVIAKFRFVSAANEWRLFCQFRDLKWRAYQPLASAPDFETLLQEVDRDPTGIFWG